ncbi:MAG TPA: DGQHR domain-containing protein [Sedimentisphaerales bacterium]
MAKFVGEINHFEFELFWQHTIELPGQKCCFDSAIRMKHRDAEEWILMELKDYEDPGLLVPHCQKFGEQCTLFQQKFPDCKVHRLLIIKDADAASPPVNLAQECLNQGINLQQFSRLQMLNDQIEGVGPEFALLEYLKNSFNIAIRYEAAVTTEVLAIKHSFQNKVNYTFSIPAKKLLPIAYVFRATATGEASLEEAYQRSIDQKRLPKIRKFILSGHVASMFPTNIVANIPIGSSVEVQEHDNGTATISLPNEYAALHIIDGQHRLFSLCRATEDEWNTLNGYPFLVTAYKGMLNKDQAKIFFSINDEQTGINPNLICYILSRLQDDKEGIAASIALSLQKIGLFDKDIYNGVGKRNGRWLNLKTFVDSLTPSQSPKDRNNLIDYSQEGVLHGWLQRHGSDKDTPLEILKEYFTIISEQFPTDWREGRTGFCQNNAGVAVWLRILLRIAKQNGTLSNFSENWDRKMLSRHIRKCDYRILKKRVPDLDADEWRRARNESEYEAIAQFIWKEIA